MDFAGSKADVLPVATNDMGPRISGRYLSMNRATNPFGADVGSGSATRTAAIGQVRRASMASQIRPGVSVPLNRSIAMRPVGEVTLISVR